MPASRNTLANYAARHFQWKVSHSVAILTLNRPERKNPLTFDSYAELRDLFRTMTHADDVKAVIMTGAGENFCSGGDVHEIIGPLTKLDMPGLLAFTRMTGDLVKAMRACPQPIVAAIDGICAGAGAMLALASDIRFGTARSKTAFLFTRVGLAGCDMGACATSAARDRPGPRRGIALHRPQHGRRRSRALGIFQPAVRAGNAAQRCAGRSPRSWPQVRRSRTA